MCSLHITFRSCCFLRAGYMYNIHQTFPVGLNSSSFRPTHARWALYWKIVPFLHYAEPAIDSSSRSSPVLRCYMYPVAGYYPLCAQNRSTSTGWVGIVWSQENSLINTGHPSDRLEPQLFSRSTPELSVVLTRLRIEIAEPACDLHVRYSAGGVRHAGEGAGGSSLLAVLSGVKSE